MGLKKLKKIMTAIFIIILLFISVLYIKYKSLGVYEWNGSINGDVISKDGVAYEDNYELFKKYLNGQIKADGIVGRFKGDKFLGFKTWVIKLKGFDEKDAFLIRGLMYEAAYSKQ